MISTFKIGNLTCGTLASGYLITKLTGFGSPSVRVDVKDRGSFHGADLGSYLYGRREIGIELEILGTDKSDYEVKRRALEQACDLHNGTTTLLLNTRSGLILQNDAIVSADLDMPYNKGNVVFSTARLEFTIPFPFFKSKTTYNKEINLWAGGGFEVPFGIPMSMSAGASVVDIVTNNGNTRSYPIFTLYGALEDPSILNDTTDQTMYIDYDLANGNYITIDTYNRTVLLNGTTNIKQYVSGDWIYLASGNNSIRLSASDFDEDGTLFVSYKDMYLGI